MDFGLFGIGFDKILLIAIVALIVFGPDKLPVMARQAGKWVNDLRRLTQEARGEIQNLTKEMDLSELSKMRADLADLRKDLTDTTKDLLTPLQDIRKEINLTDAAGNPVATQYEQSTYQVEKLPDGEGVVVEETTTRETIIQDLVSAGEPVAATETVTTSTGAGFIAPAVPMPVVSAVVPTMLNGNGASEFPPEHPASQTPALPSDDGLSMHELLTRAAPQPEWQRQMLDLESHVQTNRQEMYERLEALEQRFVERLDRIEAALGLTAGQSQGG